MESTDYEPVYFDEFAASLEKLDKPTKEVAEKRIMKILENPFLSKPLRGDALKLSERFLVYRIVFRVEGRKVFFLRLGKRDNVYSQSF